MTREEKITALSNMCGAKESCSQCVLHSLSTCHFEILPGKEVDRRFDVAFPDSVVVPSAKVDKHQMICTELNALYAKKNHDYGDSFHLSYVEEGMAMARIRLGDKLNRFKTLSRATEQEVSDESLRDTLIDLANYAIMTIMELEETHHE